jgi:SAM-dependent methyltransferase
MAIGVNWSKVRYQISRLLEHDFKDKSVLEVGVGFGVVPGMLRNLASFRDYQATDLSPEFRRLTKQFWGIEAKAARSTDLPFEADRFDVLIALDVMEHIHPDDREKTAQEFNRVLKDKARFFINNPITYHYKNLDVLSGGSFHSDYDYGLELRDIVQFAEIMEMRVELIQEYKVEEGSKHTYQWIILAR